MPVALWGAETLDHHVEEAARRSHNLRVVLQQRVEVRSEDGVVELKGTVQDLQQKALAEETVRVLPGVRGVENKLDVQLPGRERGDGWLELKIRGILLLRSDVPRTARVNVSEGVVTLTGVVEDEKQRELAAALARNVEGVKDVRNELRVRSSNHTAVAESGADAMRLQRTR